MSVANDARLAAAARADALRKAGLARDRKPYMARARADLACRNANYLSNAMRRAGMPKSRVQCHTQLPKAHAHIQDAGYVTVGWRGAVTSGTFTPRRAPAQQKLWLASGVSELDTLVGALGERWHDLADMQADWLRGVRPRPPRINRRR